MTSKSEPCAQFHLFPRLPTEIRWMIWRRAIITDATPRIHYYSLYHDADDGCRRSFLKWFILQNCLDPKPHPRDANGNLQILRRPQLRSQPCPSTWLAGNRFLYYWDGGLRTACKESRMILLEDSRATTKTVSTEPKDIIEAYDNHHKKIYFEVRSSDIVCLSFAPEDMAVCRVLQWDALLVRLPFVHLPQTPYINIAFNFNDIWDKDLGMTPASVRSRLLERSGRGLVMRLFLAWRMGRVPRSTRVWLIDRGGRLPANYDLGGVRDDRSRDAVYAQQLQSDRQESHVFFDGMQQYVESYTWDEPQEFHFHFRGRRDVPVISFMWKLQAFCLPPRAMLRHTRNCPNPYGEPFFRVLRPLNKRRHRLRD